MAGAAFRLVARLKKLQDALVRRRTPRSCTIDS
jgi:hypothetical protein